MTFPFRPWHSKCQAKGGIIYFLFCFMKMAFWTFNFSSFLPSLLRFTKCEDTGENSASVGELSLAFNLDFKPGSTGVDEERRYFARAC